MILSSDPRAKQYQRIRNTLFFVELVFYFLFLIILTGSGFSKSLKNIILIKTQQVYFVNGFYVIVLAVLAYILAFPLNIYEGYFLEHRFGLSRQTIFAWFKDDLKKQCISLIIFLVSIEALYFFLRYFSTSWWLWAGIFWIVISLLLAKFAPLVIIPLFFKYLPLKDESLKERLLELLARAHSRIKEIFVIDFSKKTKKANAFVTGLGRTQRLVLCDTLLEDFSKEEIGLVVAHELGHHKNKDMLRLVIFSSIITFLSLFAAHIFFKMLILFFGFSGIDDIAGFPLFCLIIFAVSILVLPLQNGFSRHLEKRADIYALRLSEDAMSFICMMEKLGKRNLSDFAPHPLIKMLLYDHPPIGERIELARGFLKNYEESLR